MSDEVRDMIRYDDEPLDEPKFVYLTTRHFTVGWKGDVEQTFGAVLREDVVRWVRENTTHFYTKTLRGHSPQSVRAGILFDNDRDAVLFKTFWL